MAIALRVVDKNKRTYSHEDWFLIRRTGVGLLREVWSMIHYHVCVYTSSVHTGGEFIIKYWNFF